MPLNLARNMRVTAARIDGQPAELFDRDLGPHRIVSLADDRQVLLVLRKPLDPGQPHEIELHHEGAVIQRAGDGVYYVAARGTWYPRIGVDLANYDLIFRYPKNLALVASGSPVEDRTEGDWRITHRKPDSPIRFAGFNLGDFQSVALDQSGYHIEVFANRSLEKALAPPDRAATASARQPSPQAASYRTRAGGIYGSGSPPCARPGARVQQLTKSVVDALEFMTSTTWPGAAAEPRYYADSRPIRAGFSGPDLSFDARLSQSGAAPRPVRATSLKRLSFPNSWRPTRSRINGGATWWCPPAIMTVG